MSAPVIVADDVGRRARRRIALRLLPYVLLLYIIAYLDRNNLATAALQMPHDLGFDDRVIGFGAGIFALGYVILEIPGTLIIERWSARRWIARIMVSWGLVTIGMAFIRTAHQFYTIRFLLGLAEAGFFPGIIVYLTHWFVYEDRAKAIAGFMAAIPLAYVVGSPISGVTAGRPLGQPARLAVVVHSGRPARAVLWRYDLVLSDRLAASGQVVASR